MRKRNGNDESRRTRGGGFRAKEKSASKVAEGRVPEIYEVVVECRHEREQQAVFERMRGEGFRCRLLTL